MNIMFLFCCLRPFLSGLVRVGVIVINSSLRVEIQIEGSFCKPAESGLSNGISMNLAYWIFGDLTIPVYPLDAVNICFVLCSSVQWIQWGRLRSCHTESITIDKLERVRCIFCRFTWFYCDFLVILYVHIFQCVYKRSVQLYIPTQC